MTNNNYTNDYDSEIDAKYKSLKEEGAFDKMRHETSDYLYSDLEKFEKQVYSSSYDGLFDDCEYEPYEKDYITSINLLESPCDESWEDIIEKDIEYENSIKKEIYLYNMAESVQDEYPHISIIPSEDSTKNGLFEQLTIAENIRYRDEMWFYYSTCTQSFHKITQQKIERLIFNDLPQRVRLKLNRRRMNDLLYLFMRDDSYMLPEQKHPNYVKCLNGTYIISEEFLDQSSRPNGDHIDFDYCINANYKSGVTLDDAPAFKRFLKTSLEGNSVKIKSVLQTIGYLLSDRQDAKKAIIFFGKPNTGKSLLIKLIEYMMGSDNVSNISLHNLDERFLTAELAENRLNINAEISEAPLASIDVFKLIVGGDMLTAEKKGKDPFKFRCQCKLLFAGNVLPKLKNIGYTDAFFDRLHIINFNTSITEKDRNLESKLRGEVDVIFSLAMNELSELVSSNYNFAVSDDSNSVINEYRKNIDSVEAFINECCIFDEKAITAKDDLYQEYCTYCKETGINEISEKTFDKEFLKKNPAVSGKKSRCGGIYKNPKSCYVGVQINSNKEEADIDDIR